LRRSTGTLLAQSVVLALTGMPAWGDAGSGNAGADSAASELDQLVVTATRVTQSSADLPVSIDRVSQQQIRDGQLQVNLSESLDVVPGINVENRQNYAQDLQISVRGFGARSSFGVRGVRLFADGIPGTMPDGQGQYSNFDLGSADRVEVLRGPFSALYGNSSGGVISIYTQDAPLGERVSASVDYGRFDTQRYAVEGLLGQSDGVNLVADAVHFYTGGFRDHSSAERNVANVKARWQLDADSTLQLVVNAIDAPTSLDPLGLTRAQLTSDRDQAGTGALLYNSRKAVQQEQVGADYERSLGAQDHLSATTYVGQRLTSQFQAIPMATETAATNPGGVIGLAHGYWGADVHVTDERELGGTALQSTAGIAYDNLDEARRSYLNFIGTQLGVQGQQRSNYGNQAYDLDEYLQLQWDPVQPLRAVVGVRNNVVVITSDNHFAAAGTNPESSARYTAVNPVAGLTWRFSPLVNAYGSYGKGFETPTLDELAYRSTNGSLPGLNFGLQPARSDNYEVGFKSSASAPLRATLDGFYIHTVNEVAVAANAAGRSVYENIPETRRRGTEAELQSDLPYGLSANLAYTYIQALTLQPYVSCSTVPCVPTLVSAGHRIPAVPAGTIYSGLTWHSAPAGLAVTFEAIAHSQMFANDLNTAVAQGYWLFNFHAGVTQSLPHWDFTESFRIDNLLNRLYVGSVIVNETNTRFFEPEPTRSAFLMFSASYR
jgi:iron complex outermembrane receptor protein